MNARGYFQSSPEKYEEESSGFYEYEVLIVRLDLGDDCLMFMSTFRSPQANYYPQMFANIC